MIGPRLRNSLANTDSRVVRGSLLRRIVFAHGTFCRVCISTVHSRTRVGENSRSVATCASLPRPSRVFTAASSAESPPRK